MEYLLRTFDYNPETGLFSRKSKPGRPAGRICKDGKGKPYWKVGVNNQEYYAHRLIWFIYYGVESVLEIDHRDDDGLNNKITNLREVTQAQNAWNRGIQSNNKTGHKGIRFNGKKYVAQIKVNGKVWSKTFESFAEAARAYRGKSLELQGEFSPFYQNQNEA